LWYWPSKMQHIGCSMAKTPWWCLNNFEHIHIFVDDMLGTPHKQHMFVWFRWS
jgi:hypothetical protein